MDKFFDYFGSFSDFLSIIGFIVTLFVFFGLREIKKKYLFRATAEEQVKSIVKLASELSSLLNSFNRNRIGISTLMHKLEATLENMQNKVDTKAVRKRIKYLRKEIKKCIKKPEEALARSVYSTLNGVIQSLKEHMNDSQWESN